MIADVIPLFYLVRVVCLILCLGIALLVYNKRRDYVLNKIISSSFLLFAIGYSIEGFSFFFSDTLQENSSYLMALIVLTVTTAIYLIFLVAYSLVYGEENIKNKKLIGWSYIPFIFLWFLALVTGSFNFKQITENSTNYWLFEPNPLGTIAVVLSAFIYLILAFYFLIKVYRVSTPEMKPVLSQFTFGVTFAILFGILIVILATVFSQTDEIQFINQSLRPVGVAVGGIFIARSFLKNN